MISRDMDHDKGDWLYEVKRDKALDKRWEAENGMNPPPPYETCMATRKGASHPLDPSPCMACPSCKRNQYRRALEMDLIRHREALLDMRSDMREPAEREGGLVRHFYDRICDALEYRGASLTDEEKIIERQELIDRIAQLEKDYDHAVETIQEIVNRVRPLLPAALEGKE